MIPVCAPWLPGKEKEYVNEAISTGWIGSSGKFIERFEDLFAKYCRTSYGVSCCNGTVALHLALAALGIKKGDEVVIPAFTMIATANAVLYTGATPVLVDCDEETWCIDSKKIEEKITPKTRAIMPVHIYGHPCDMDPIIETARKHNLHVIEDAAEAHGAEYKGKRCGSLGDIGCFSFYVNKIITTGEGGMCVTNSKELAERMKKLKNHAFETPRFVHKEGGFNYRFTNIHAAIGLAQAENAEKLVEARRSTGLRYNKLLQGVKGLILPVEKPYAKNVYWMYGVLLDDKVKLSKEEVMKKLDEAGIETRSFFMPMNLQPVFLNKTIENSPDCSGQFPVADKLWKRGILLPSSSNLTEEEARYVADTLKEILS